MGEGELHRLLEALDPPRRLSARRGARPLRLPEAERSRLRRQLERLLGLGDRARRTAVRALDEAAIVDTKLARELCAELHLASHVLTAHELDRELVALAETAPRALLAWLRHRAELVQRLDEVARDRFLEQGVQLASDSEAAGEAFFALQSRSAQRALRQLESRMTLEERRDVLHLFAEAIAASPVPIEAWNGAEGQRWIQRVEASRGRHDSESRTFAGTDGARIFLPAEIDRFDDRDANASAYTVLTLRQIGLFLNGTLDLRAEDLGEALPQSSEPSVFRRLFDATASPQAAAAVFSILEERRIAAALARSYPGFATGNALLCREELKDLEATSSPGATVLLHSLALRAVAGETALPTNDQPVELVQALGAAIERVSAAPATVGTSARLMLSLLRDWPDSFVDDPFLVTLPLEALEERRDEARAGQDLSSLLAAAEELGESSEDFLAKFGVTAADPLGALSIQDGSLFSLSGLLQAEDDTEVPWQLPEHETDAPPEVEEPIGPKEVLERKGAKVVQALRRRQAAETIYRYDEWDHEIDDYRPGWCALREIRLEVPDSSTPEAVFVRETRRDLAPLARRVRKQLEQLKPELYRRIPRLIDGDELDLDAAIEAVSDLRAGLSPSEKLYVRRNKQERDVAAVFLLDLSASTDEEVSDPAEAEAPDSEKPADVDYVDILAGAEPAFPSDRDPLWGSWPPTPVEPGEPKRRVLDVEREAVVLMADALGTLGDAYAVYGFSGYGREGVEFYIAKDFDDAWDEAAEGRLGAMRPRQSTRMGPAIRHALRKLDRQEAKVKALLMLSDGFPQDHDYGRDRNSHEHGIQDTMMALREAELRGIDTFCLTVDPAGHDYLRRMCPDQQYLVLEETVALARELPKVYRGITG